MGDIANIAQLAGLDAIKLIGLIAKAANTARMHKKNCKQFAQHLKLIGNLLQQLQISELKRYPETREPLEQLEDELRRAYILVTSCQDRSYLYLLAMGWNIVYQFRKAQNEIDRYLKLVPLITLVDNARVKERLRDIDNDQREYTLDEEDRRVHQTVILNPETDTMTLKKNLSRSYNCSFNEALRKENEKLRLELQQSQHSLDVNQCEMILRLLDLTEAASSFSCGNKGKVMYEDYAGGKFEYMDYVHTFDDQKVSMEMEKSSSTVTEYTGYDLQGTKESYQREEWNTDLLECCAEPCLCMRTFFYPCGTFAKIASVANSKQMSSCEACNELMTYSLILSCCCYTCCVRTKLRRVLNITGGMLDDFLSHFMCCCCALVQEWREVEIRGVYGQQKTKTSPPSSQFMEY